MACSMSILAQISEKIPHNIASTAVLKSYEYSLTEYWFKLLN